MSDPLRKLLMILTPVLLIIAIAFISVILGIDISSIPKILLIPGFFLLEAFFLVLVGMKEGHSMITVIQVKQLGNHPLML